MCGIFAIFNSTLPPKELRKNLIDCAFKIRHRGPDWSGYKTFKNGTGGIAHERLSCVDPESGKQPFVHKFDDGNEIICAANGEVYNYKALYAEINPDPKNPFYKPQTGSDCEVFLACYLKYGRNFGEKLNGMYACVIHDTRDNSFFVLRDHLGIAPLYIGYGKDGSTWVGSEMKALWESLSEYEEFPPGHIFNSETNSFEQWYNPKSLSKEIMPINKVDYLALRNKVTECMRRCVVDNCNWGVLLSGGLDSSIVASVAVRLIKEQGLPLEHFRSFSIGLAGSPDAIAAKEVADFLGIKHHDFTFTVQEGLDAIGEVIEKLETYDPQSIRCGIPMFLLMRKIKAVNFKVVLSGDGADELFGGYLYMNKAPDAKEFHRECIDKVNGLHANELLRNNILAFAWGVEGRVPMLDPELVDFVMSIDPSEKMPIEGKRIEKHLLRKAFDTPDDPYLPSSILWRQKEQFSDGVGYAWSEALKTLAEKQVSDRQLSHAHIRFRYNTPITKEAYYYRVLFQELYPKNASAYAIGPLGRAGCSTENAAKWDPIFQSGADISGRVMSDIHTGPYISNTHQVSADAFEGGIKSPKGLKRAHSAAFA